MKAILLLFLSFVTGSGFELAIVAPSEPEEAEAWYRSIMADLLAAEQLKNTPEKIELLGKTVRNFGNKLDIQTDPRWRGVFDEARDLLLETPGHAEHFATELEDLRATNKSEYHRWRNWIIADTLPYLPSPDTIKVLGNYLTDKRDSPSTINSDTVSPPENAFLSAYSLSRIGLRNAPFRAAPSWISLVYDPSYKDCLPQFLEWWEIVKSGQLSISFVGQRVSYRFNPDGTWEVTPLAISDEALKEELKPSVPPTSAATLPPAESTVPHSAISTRWLWIAGAATMLIAAVAWLARKLKR